MRELFSHIKSKLDLETFIVDGLLTENEAQVLRLYFSGKSRIEQSLILNVSVATIDRIFKRIKKKYNNIFPDVDI